MVADVRQAFLNIEIDEKDKNFVRFLFVDPDEENKLIVYRFNRVCFGLTNSPFLLNATIKYHMNTLKHEPEFTEKTKRDIYVDDVTSAVNSLEEGKRFYTFLTDSMSCAGLSLQKWYSNSNELRRFMKCDGGENKMRKVLGIPWYDDQFIFDFRSVVGDVNPPLTKRNVLSVGSKFYDPLGLISPVVLIAKLFFQKLCLDELMWDDPLPEGLQKLWKKYVNDLLEVGFISVERYLFKGSGDEVKLINLHGFCDASNHAYCAVIYVQAETRNGSMSRIITSKTKVAPIKKLSIPRLELLSCLLLSEIMMNVYNALLDVVSIDNIFLWSDSEVALAWIKGDKHWKSWISNRVEKIKKMTDSGTWKYVKTNLNPADIGTRNISVQTFPDDNLWWYGPSFINQNVENVRIIDENFNSVDVDVTAGQEVEKANPELVLTVDASHDRLGVGRIIKFEQFSELKKLLRVVAYVFRFINHCRGNIGYTGTISAEENDYVQKKCIKWDQDEIVNKKQFNNLKKQLSLKSDEDGILRIEGRLKNSCLPEDTKHPILLNTHGYLTRLIILDAHCNVKHMRLKSTLNEIRAKYWICRGKQIVKSVIKPCVVCKYVNARPKFGPPPPDLPAFRVKYEFAFTNVGIDFAGPLFVKEIYSYNSMMYKAYILIFTCGATRSVHLELCPNMSCSCLIRCLKRFIGRRGKFSMAISDNFSTFISEELQQFLTSEKIKWKYILQKSPWWGAFY